MGGAPPDQPIIGDDIPVELTLRPQWVCWQWDWREDRWTKPPYNARTGGFARTNDPATWASFAEVQATRQRYDGGIGYVLTRDDPYAGIDLDNCRDPATGEIAPWARAIVDHFATYTEVSPSGTGLRLVIRGQLPAGGRKRGDLEVYGSGRYLSMTGARLSGTPESIEPRQEALESFLAEHFAPQPPPLGPEAGAPPPPPRDSAGPAGAGPRGRWSLDDPELLAQARRARNGPLFERLWTGDPMGDHSKADLMLCGILAFWTGRDPAQIDRLFRRSGLMRAKWDTRHFADGRSYGQATIQRAIGGCREIYTPVRAPGQSR